MSLFWKSRRHRAIIRSSYPLTYALCLPKREKCCRLDEHCRFSTINWRSAGNQQQKPSADDETSLPHIRIQPNIFRITAYWRVTSVCIKRFAPHHMLTKNLLMISSGLHPRLEPGSGRSNHELKASMLQSSGILCIKAIPPHGVISLSVNPISKFIVSPKRKSYVNSQISHINRCQYFNYLFLINFLLLRNRNLMPIA